MPEDHHFERCSGHDGYDDRLQQVAEFVVWTAWRFV